MMITILLPVNLASCWRAPQGLPFIEVSWTQPFLVWSKFRDLVMAPQISVKLLSNLTALQGLSVAKIR